LLDIARNSKLKLSLILNFIVRISMILISLALVPILIDYLGKDKYGIWLTISAVIAWFNYFDLGLGNGFRNKLTEALAKKKGQEILSLISSTYFVITIISILLILVYLIALPYVNWAQILNFKKFNSSEINNSVSILFISFFIIFILKLIGLVYASLQLTFVDNLVKSIARFVYFLIILVIMKLSFNSSLVYVSIASILPIIFVYLILSIYFFIVKHPLLLPKLFKVKLITVKSVMRLGINFFIIQIGCLVLFSTDNIIIAKLLSPSAVTDYNISYKYFNIPSIFFSLFISTHWSALTDALVKQDFKWIKSKMKIFNIIFILLCIGLVIFYFLFDFVIKIWIGDKVINSSSMLNINMVIYFAILAFASVYMYVINASGKLQVQTISYIIIALINIPLSIFFVKYFNMGASGVILASSICILILAVLMPIQYSKIINNKAKGIWVR